MDASDDPAPAGAGGGGDKLRLKVAAGNAVGTVIEVEDELVIGRQAEGVGTLAQDVEISRRHARIASDAEGRYLIEDLGSTNGTYVNGRAVESPVGLEPGDRIEVGASALVVQVVTPASTPRSTPVTTTSAQAEEEPEPPAPAPEPAVEAVQEASAAGESGGPLDAETGLPRLGLRVDVDLEAGEVTVALDEEGGEARFVHEHGVWRLKPL